MKMPPLPEAKYRQVRETITPTPALEWFSADQMRAYGEMVREECAMVCMRIGESEYPTDIDDCIAAIRKTMP